MTAIDDAFKDDPGFLLRLADAGLSEIEVDSAKYQGFVHSPDKREEIGMTDTVLVRVMRMHRFLSEHEGEVLIQNEIAEAIGEPRGQSDISKVLRWYPDWFMPVGPKGRQRFYPVPLPKWVVDDYAKLERGEEREHYYQKEGEPAYHKVFSNEIKTILQRIEEKLDNESSPVETNSASRGKSADVTKRPYLDEAIINHPAVQKIYNRDPGLVDEDGEDWDLKAILSLFYKVMRLLDEDIPGVMEILSRNMKDPNLIKE